jgi:hypothetical protein
MEALGGGGLFLLSEVPQYRNPRPSSDLELLERFESTRDRWASQIGPFMFLVLTSDCSVQSRVKPDISTRLLVDFSAKFIVWMVRRSTTRMLYCRYRGFL